MIGTNTCNSNILDELNNMMKQNRQYVNIYSQNMIGKQTRTQQTYHSFGGVAGVLAA
jgi:hypothetical protein